MSIIRVTGFLGANQARQAMLIPETVGVSATNQKPGRGDLRPWNAPLNKATVPAGRQTIHRMGRDTISDTHYWLSWISDVHVVVAGNADDTDERTFYTGSGTPKWTTKTLALASAPYPTAYRELGVPAPTTTPTLSAAEATAVVAGGFVVDSQYTIVSEGTTDWIAIGASRPVIPAGEFIVGKAYTIKVAGTTDFTLIGAIANDVGVVFTATGVGAGSGFATQNSMVGEVFTATGVGSGTGTAVEKTNITETRFYVYTCVNDIDEESAPSPVSLELTCKSNDTVTVSNLAAPSGSYGINRFRIYRTQTSSTGADFYFLREIVSTNTSTTDDGRVLGEVLPTTTWLMPPTGLSFLTGLWNGMLAAIDGRSVRFCEAYTYYAWPIAYEILPMNAQPVALATFGQTLVMLTDGNPSFITGGTPDAMDEQPIEWSQACIAPKSAVGMGHGVAWASPDGLAYVGSGTPRLLTADVLTRDDWQALNPSSIVGAMYEGRYFGFYTSGTKKGFIIDPANPQGMYFLDFGVDAVHVDALQDALFVLDGVNVQKWDAGSALTTTFKSKLFHQPKPVKAFACAEVIGSYPCTFKLYADGVLKHTQTVTSADPFRLPGGYYGQDFQIEVSTSGNIQAVAVAHSMAELGTT